MSGELWAPWRIGGNGPEVWAVGRQSALLSGQHGAEGRIELWRGDDGEVAYFDAQHGAVVAARRANGGGRHES